MKKIIAVLAFLTLSQPGWCEVKNPYDETANAKTQIEAAQASAKVTNKSTLIVFGANWCGDCKVLDTEMHHGALAKLVDERVVVVKVDVGRMDKNKDVTERYGNVIKKGIPSVVLLRANGSVAYQTNGGELADARKMGREGLTTFFSAMLNK